MASRKAAITSLLALLLIGALPFIMAGLGTDQGAMRSTLARRSQCEDHVWFEDRWMVAPLCDE
jgi:hypothetical protein